MQAVKVAQWVIEEENKNLHLSLVGFLKPDTGGEARVEAWLQHAWGQEEAL